MLLPQTTSKTPGGQTTSLFDSSNIVKNGCANPNHVFDLFGSFGGNTGTEVHVKLLEIIAADMPFFEMRSSVCLQMRLMNLETWVETITNELVYCDELALMGLCYMYHRHCVVLTQNTLWSTVQADKPLNLLDLLNICSVHLIYLGNLHFGVLTWRPRLPKKVATQSPGFNIVEEYTLDDANSTVSADKDNKKPPEHMNQVGNVETDKLCHKNLQCSEGTTNTSTVVKNRIEIASKADSTDLNNLTSQSATVGDHVTSSTEQCKETGVVAKPPSHATTVPGQTDQSECISPNTQLKLALHVATKTEEDSQIPQNNVGERTPQTNSEKTVK